ncbi:uncharacterized protein PFL1_02980 [Pseudozyma flocculosa PF-1]|uniref:Uncharacterized protein n=2 Tax=Pseudozyma flocculosa TaxID=84751 RepID=A0A5C3F137_9BASI|nr:uncharacterized protein PFL1_02980 [Pseudozyma flocculosa PF-1]EPQ29225.1 hypothetical protein PFL1_02980 [Pseudozyma flocculosa PF-1]SPO37725.1 uncharacterized protein PSFLO_03201 [Pseudozyma flocculosa]
MIIAFIAFLLAITFSVGISVLISQPFSGAITRLRANYLPKAVSLDNVLEDGASAANPRALSAFLLSERRSTAKIGPVVPGVLSMLMRTKRLEGWAGVYKGSAPIALQLILLSTLTFVFFSGTQTSAAGGQYKAAPSAPGQFGFFTNLFYMLFASLVALPLNVVSYRTIVHPRILPWNRPRDNLRELLSYQEYSQPWRLYLLPGLLAANIAHVAWIGLATRIVRQLTVPSLGGLDPAVPAAPGQEEYSGPNSSMLEVSSFGLAVFVLWNVLSVVVLAPLEVVMVRLSTQQPERQNPLHRAYARAPTSAAAAGPAPYNNQATVAAQTQPGGGYSDDAPAKASTEADRKSLDRDAAAGASDLPSRPSFAIEDDEDDEESPRRNADSQTASADGPASSNNKSSRVQLGGLAGGAQSFGGGGSNNSGGAFGSSNVSGSEPPEPVIALRPIEEQSVEEAAAEFGAPVVQRYEGLLDCVNKMVDEEGLESLSRGAWVTMLGVFAGSFS